MNHPREYHHKITCRICKRHCWKKEMSTKIDGVCVQCIDKINDRNTGRLINYINKVTGK